MLLRLSGVVRQNAPVEAAYYRLGLMFRVSLGFRFGWPTNLLMQAPSRYLEKLAYDRSLNPPKAEALNLELPFTGKPGSRAACLENLELEWANVHKGVSEN